MFLFLPKGWSTERNRNIMALIAMSTHAYPTKCPAVVEKFPGDTNTAHIRVLGETFVINPHAKSKTKMDVGETHDCYYLP